MTRPKRGKINSLTGGGGVYSASYARGAIPNAMGSTRCRATPASGGGHMSAMSTPRKSGDMLPAQDMRRACLTRERERARARV